MRSRRGDHLAVSWIHGGLQVAVYRRQQALAVWESPRPLRTLEEFADGLKDAVEQLEFRGLTAALVIEREDFSHQMESIPPASRRTQRDYIRNRALRNAGATPQTYAYQRTFSPKTEQNVILHLLPQAVFDQIVATFEALHLQLGKFFPLFALLPQQLHRLELERDEIVLMVTENAGVTSMVAGRRDGQILFGRSIFNDWRRDANRVATEINRSILFARQRFGITIDTVYLVGESISATRDALQPLLDRSFLLKTGECPAREWLGHVHRLPGKDTANLLADRLQHQAQRKLVRFVFTGTIWLVFALAALAALRAEWNYQLRQSYIADLQHNRAQLESTLAMLVHRETTARQSTLLVGEVLENKAPPVAASFSRWLAPQLPDFLRLTSLTVAWQPAESAWTFRIEGVSRAEVDETLLTLDELETRLTTPPFRARITTNNQVALGSFVSRRTLRPEREFFIEGRFFDQ